MITYPCVCVCADKKVQILLCATNAVRLESCLLACRPMSRPWVCVWESKECSGPALCFLSLHMQEQLAWVYYPRWDRSLTYIARAARGKQTWCQLLSCTVGLFNCACAFTGRPVGGDLAPNVMVCRSGGVKSSQLAYTFYLGHFSCGMLRRWTYTIHNPSPPLTCLYGSCFTQSIYWSLSFGSTSLRCFLFRLAVVMSVDVTVWFIALLTPRMFVVLPCCVVQ